MAESTAVASAAQAGGLVLPHEGISISAPLGVTVPRGAVVVQQPEIRNVSAPVAGRAEMVPGHFDGVKVSHVPLAEAPQVVKPGTPRTPPTVIQASPEQGGGKIYQLDSTWDMPVPPPASAGTAPPPKKSYR